MRARHSTPDFLSDGNVSSTISMRILRTIVLLTLLTLPTVAQDIPQNDAERTDTASADQSMIRLGLYGGFVRNMHETQATLFTGGGECGAFDDGSGNGFAVGLVGDIPIIGDWLGLTVSMMYAQRGGAFGEVFTTGLPIQDPNSGRYTMLERRHNYSAKLDYVIGSLGVQAMPYPAIPVYIKGMGTIGHIPGKASHRQIEEIISPSGVVYPETNATTREVSSGPITGTGTTFGVAGALGVRLPLGKNLTASPEIGYYHPLNDVTPSYRWRISSLQAGVIISWGFGGAEPMPDAPPAEIAESTPPPSSETDASPVEMEDMILAQIPPQDIAIVETIVTETFPLLPYVFFDSASSEIPMRYTRLSSEGREAFDERELPHRSLGTYYTMLNVVGSRMSKTPSIRIRLNGTTDRREESIPGAADNLARSRAQGVKDYLVKEWEIDPARIAITTTMQPTFPSSMEYAEGAEENRRVEITSESDDLLAPIIHERFSEYSVDPKEFHFSTGDGMKGVMAWGLKVSTGGKRMWEQYGVGDLPSRLSWPLTKEAMSSIGEASHRLDSLYCELTVTKGGRTLTKTLAIPSSKTRYPYEVSRLSLIVFDFDKSEIGAQNRRMVSSFVARSITPVSTATITGSTDRLGELDHNQELSEARAWAVHHLITDERPAAQITDTKGVGPSNLLYDNALPEGRYYCRTVQVEVKTPTPEMSEGQ